MQSKYNKTIVLVGLFLIVLAVGILVKTDAGQGYISWLKATALNVVGINVEAPSDAGITDNIDYSNININGLAKGDNAAKTVQKEAEETSIAPSATKAPEKSVEEIISDISEQVARIDGEVKQIAAYNEIQRQIDQIAIQTNQIGQSVNNIRTSSQITEIQQQINVLSQQVSLLIQQLSINA